jgi:hypothetical protein
MGGGVVSAGVTIGVVVETGAAVVVAAIVVETFGASTVVAVTEPFPFGEMLVVGTAVEAMVVAEAAGLVVAVAVLDATVTDSLPASAAPVTCLPAVFATAIAAGGGARISGRDRRSQFDVFCRIGIHV